MDIKLDNHIPSILPMKGKRIYVCYPGQAKLCKNCFFQGHIQKDCPEQSKGNWLDFVARILKTGKFDQSLFGSWIDALNKYHPEYNRPDPQDLRQVMDFNHRGVGRGDLRRQIGFSGQSDLRQRIGFENGNEFRGRGRGRGRARGNRGYNNYRGYQ